MRRRDEKRHQEKKNKSERAKKKKEDIARVRVLVDRALAADPRIKQFKADEKAARELKKRGGPPPIVVDPKVAAEEAAKKQIEDDRIAAELASKNADDKVRSFIPLSLCISLTYRTYDSQTKTR